jgi:regulator of sigma E protease
MKGESVLDPVASRAKGSFGAASILARLFILVAGVGMNYLLALVLLTIGFSAGHWIPSYASLADMKAAMDRGEVQMDLAVLVQHVNEDGAAAKAGVLEGDIITAVDGQPVDDPAVVQEMQKTKSNVRYTLLTGTGTQTHDVAVVLKNGKSGVLLGSLARNVTSPLRNPVAGFTLALRESWVVTSQTAIGLGKLFFSLAGICSDPSGHLGFCRPEVPEGVAGIVGIAQLTYQSVQEGFMTYMRLVAVLSLSLAALNILPLPALDGGRMLFVLAELVSMRRVNRRFELTVHAIGFVLLLVLLVLITFHDVFRLL